MTDGENTVYLASSFGLKDRVERVCDALEENGFVVLDRWWDDSDKQADLKSMEVPDYEWYDLPVVKERAEHHYENIREADIYVVVCPPAGTRKFNGASVELGYALAYGAMCYSVGRLERSAMYAPVTQCDTIGDLIRELAWNEPDYQHP